MRFRRGKVLGIKMDQRREASLAHAQFIRSYCVIFLYRVQNTWSSPCSFFLSKVISNTVLSSLAQFLSGRAQRHVHSCFGHVNLKAWLAIHGGKRCLVLSD